MHALQQQMPVVVPTYATHYNEKNNVHMKELRPRTFDPTTMKSARRKVTSQNNQLTRD